MRTTDYPLTAIGSGIIVLLVAATWFAAQLGARGFPMTQPGSATTPRVTTVDGLRGYLALLVVAHHSVIWLQVKRLDGEWSPRPSTS